MTFRTRVERGRVILEEAQVPNLSEEMQAILGGFRTQDLTPELRWQLDESDMFLRSYEFRTDGDQVGAYLNFSVAEIRAREIAEVHVTRNLTSADVGGVREMYDLSSPFVAAVLWYIRNAREIGESAQALRSALHRSVEWCRTQPEWHWLGTTFQDPIRDYAFPQVTQF